MTRRVVVTGIGIVSPLGDTVGELFGNLIARKSAVRRIDTRFDEALMSPVAATVDDFTPGAAFPLNKLVALDRTSQFALLAARRAIEDADLSLAELDADDVGVAVGTGMGGAATLDQAYLELYRHGENRLRPMTLVSAMHQAVAANISIEFELRGPSLTYSSACASSAIAIGEASRHIRHGYAEVMVAGGAEALLTLGTIRSWEALRTLARVDEQCPARSCRPFSRDRTGLVLGEGAAFVVLEEWSRAQRRGAPAYGELLGYGACSDACHLTQPQAEGQARAMRLALSDAGVSPADIDYINAHGTGTPAGDAVETAAIKAALGDFAHEIPVSSTKALHGHLVGAAGALEFIIALLAARHRIVPPTAHLDAPDPACDLDHVPNRPREAKRLRTVMSNSFAFGGANAVLVGRGVG